MSGPLSDVHAPSAMSNTEPLTSAQLDALQLYGKRDTAKGKFTASHNRGAQAEKNNDWDSWWM
jgi:hypothetical protein